MAELRGLKGVSVETVQCEFINKPSDVKKILNKGLAATAAGDKGAINIWRDDNGNIRCERQAWCVTQDGVIFKTFRGVSAWCKSALSEIN